MNDNKKIIELVKDPAHHTGILENIISIINSSSGLDFVTAFKYSLEPIRQDLMIDYLSTFMLNNQSLDGIKNKYEKFVTFIENVGLIQSYSQDYVRSLGLKFGVKNGMIEVSHGDLKYCDGITRFSYGRKYYRVDDRSTTIFKSFLFDDDARLREGQVVNNRDVEREGNYFANNDSGSGS